MKRLKNEKSIYKKVNEKIIKILEKRII